MERWRRWWLLATLLLATAAEPLVDFGLKADPAVFSTAKAAPTIPPFVTKKPGNPEAKQTPATMPIHPTAALRTDCVDNDSCDFFVSQGLCEHKAFPHEMRAILCPIRCGLCPNKNSTKKSGAKSFSLYDQYLDFTADPCVDFFQFTCGKYIKEHKPKTPDETLGTFDDLSKALEKNKIAALTDNFDTNSTAIQKLRLLHAKCLNVTAIEYERTTSLRAEIDRMGGSPMLLGDKWNPEKFDLTANLLYLAAVSRGDYLINFGPDKANDNHLYLYFEPAKLIIKSPKSYTEEKAAEKIEGLHDFIFDIMSLLGTDYRSDISYAGVEAGVKELVKFEMELAAIVAPEWPAPPDPDELEAKMAKIKLSKFAELFNAIHWDRFIPNHPRIPRDVLEYVADDPTVYVFTEKLMKEINDLLLKTDKRILADYLIVRFMMVNLSFLDGRFIAAMYRFADKIDGGRRRMTREEDCADIVESTMPLAVDHLFLRKYFDTNAQNAVDSMVEDIREGLGEVISGEEWMAPETRVMALKKLKQTKKIIAAVRDARDVERLDARYADVQVLERESFRESATKFGIDSEIYGIRSIIHPERFTSTEQMRTTEVNAMHIAEENTVFLSAAIAQPPLFDPKQPASINYGSLGYVVGHEFTHGFDNVGSLFNAAGHKKDWWDSKTKADFKARSQCFVAQYNDQIEPMNKKNVNGTRTLGENIADNGGIRAAFLAYRRYLSRNEDFAVPGYPNFTNIQNYFISSGLSFCMSADARYYEKMLKEDEHAPAFARVNMVVANFPEFAKAFNCKAGSPMNPERQCRVW